MTPEKLQRFVCLLSRGSPEDGHLREAASLFPAANAWPRLVDELEWHGVAPLLWHNLPNPLRAQVPSAERQRLEKTQIVAFAIGQRARRVCGRALDAIERAGVTAVVLKGMALGERVYPRPDLRPVSDVDLYVPESELERAVKALEQIGGETPPGTRLNRAHYERVVHVDGVGVELHRWFAQPERFPVDYAAFVARSVRAKVSGRDALVLSPEDTLVQLAVHLATHCFVAQLKWIVDVHQVVTTLGVQWPLVVSGACQSGATAACYFSLLAARTLLDTPVPDSVLAGLRPGLPRRWWLGSLLDVRSARVGRLTGPRWLTLGLVALPLSDDPLRVVPLAIRHEWLRLLDAVKGEVV